MGNHRGGSSPLSRTNTWVISSVGAACCRNKYEHLGCSSQPTQSLQDLHRVFIYISVAGD